MQKQMSRRNWRWLMQMHRLRRSDVDGSFERERFTHTTLNSWSTCYFGCKRHRFRKGIEIKRPARAWFEPKRADSAKVLRACSATATQLWVIMPWYPMLESQTASYRYTRHVTLPLHAHVPAPATGPIQIKSDFACIYRLCIQLNFGLVS